jgi:asparaginyl-tRNA synthetase
MNCAKDIKAFYMRLNDDGRTVAAMDVLAPGIGEIIGGSQREERLAVHGDARRFERILAYVTGLSDVRDAIPFARTPGNARY